MPDVLLSVVLRCNHTFDKFSIVETIVDNPSGEELVQISKAYTLLEIGEGEERMPVVFDPIPEYALADDFLRMLKATDEAKGFRGFSFKVVDGKIESYEEKHYGGQTGKKAEDLDDYNERYYTLYVRAHSDSRFKLSLWKNRSGWGGSDGHHCFLVNEDTGAFTVSEGANFVRQPKESELKFLREVTDILRLSKD